MGRVTDSHAVKISSKTPDGRMCASGEGGGYSLLFDRGNIKKNILRNGEAMSKYFYSMNLCGD